MKVREARDRRYILLIIAVVGAFIVGLVVIGLIRKRRRSRND